MRLMCLLALFLSGICAYGQNNCSSKAFADGTASTTVVLPIQSSPVHETYRVCLTHVVVNWGSKAGSYFWYISTAADCSVQSFRMTVTYYGIPNSLQDARDTPPQGAVVFVPSKYAICINFSTPPMAANFEVAYAP